MDDVNVFDCAKVIKQRFKVSSDIGTVIVIRKETIRKLHNMGCTDGLPDDYEESIVDYEIFKEANNEERQIAIQEVEKLVEKEEKK